MSIQGMSRVGTTLTLKSNIDRKIDKRTQTFENFDIKQSDTVARSLWWHGIWGVNNFDQVEFYDVMSDYQLALMITNKWKLFENKCVEIKQNLVSVL